MKIDQCHTCHAPLEYANPTTGNCLTCDQKSLAKKLESYSNLEEENKKLLEINRAHLNNIERDHIEHSFSAFASMQAENKQLKSDKAVLVKAMQSMYAASGHPMLLLAIDQALAAVNEVPEESKGEK